MNIDFADPQLIAVYGSWIRVQVAFYDFLFENSIEQDAKTLTSVSRQVMEQGLADGQELYESFITKIELRFKSQQQAWSEFLISSLSKRGS